MASGWRSSPTRSRSIKKCTASPDPSGQIPDATRRGAWRMGKLGIKEMHFRAGGGGELEVCGLFGGCISCIPHAEGD